MDLHTSTGHASPRHVSPRLATDSHAQPLAGSIAHVHASFTAITAHCCSPSHRLHRYQSPLLRIVILYCTLPFAIVSALYRPLSPSITLAIAISLSTTLPITKFTNLQKLRAQILGASKQQNLIASKPQSMATPPRFSRQPSLPSGSPRRVERQWRSERAERTQPTRREKEGRKEGRNLLITTPSTIRVHRVQHIPHKHSRCETGALSIAAAGAATVAACTNGDEDADENVDADTILYRLQEQGQRKRMSERQSQSQGRDQWESGSYGRSCSQDRVLRYGGGSGDGDGDRSGEIVNAVAAPGNRGLVAVGRGGCVVLVNLGKGSLRSRWREKSRRREARLEAGVEKSRRNVGKTLEGIEEASHLLVFSPNALTLYFTTPLTTSIHAYSLPNDILLPISHAHPSPPTVLAISPNRDVLLSASASPPTVLIQDKRVAGLAAMEFKDVESGSAATCAAFESKDSGVLGGTRFALGLKDGTVAVYEVILPPLDTYQTSIHDGRTLEMRIQTARVGNMTRVHKAAMGGVSAVAFLPGHRSRVVTVGHDGRCRLVDFEDGGKILRTWHVSEPATCLAMAPRERVVSERQGNSTVFLRNGAAHDHKTTETHVAVGTAAGKVLVFDILGFLLHEIDMKAPIVAIEWVGDMSAASTLPVRDLPTPETVPVVISLIEQASEIESGSLQDSEQGEDIVEQGKILRQQHLVERSSNPFIDARQDRTWMPPTASHPNVSQPTSPHVHSREPKPASATKTLAHASPHPRSPSLRHLLRKDPIVRTGRALWNFRKRSRPKPTPPAAGRSARRSRRSACCSSRRSGSTEQEFFTPPVARFPSLREGREMMCSGGNGGVPLRGVGGDVAVLLERDRMDESITRPAGRLESCPAERSQAVGYLSYPFRSMSVTGRNDFIPPHTLELEPLTLASNRIAIEDDSESQAGPSSRKRRLRDISPVPTAEASSSQSLSSSLYSRAKPRTFRGHPHALDGGSDAFSPMPQSPVHNLKRSFSFDAGFQNLEAVGTQQPVATRRSPVWRGGRRNELSRLHTDTEVLKRQICGLREEFEMLRSVLLRAESRRRWGECLA